MKVKYFLIILLFLISTRQYGQTFEEYKKQQESEFAAYKQKQQDFIDQMQNEFDEYVKQQDQEFANYLEEQWKSFKIFKGEELPAAPKPPAEPKYDPKISREDAGIIKLLKMPQPVVEITRTVPPPIIKKSPGEEVSLSGINLSYYGNNLSFEFDEQIIIPPPAQINGSGISKYWKSFSESNYDHLLNQFQNYKSIMNLNDWAYYLLLKTFTAEVYPKSEIGADLLLWSLLTRSGYKARIGYTKNEISILLPTYNTLYSKLFLKSDGLNFYMMKELKSENIQTYSKDHPDANTVMDFNFERPLNFAKNIGQKSFSINHLDKQYSFNIDYNKNLIDFYSDFPQVNIDVYFNAAVSSTSKESIIRVLSEIISEIPETRAVGFLLHFVQTAFNYEIDDKQFGKEKFLFAEETIFYPSSDCEDRSVLFAFLVKELLNFKVIGLDYPGHVSTAVKLPNAAEGDYVLYENEKYFVADATYENAPLGVTMPRYKNKKPEVIVLRNAEYYENVNQSYWDLANEAGGFRGDNLNDLISDDKGNVYLTGYFIGRAGFGDYLLESGNENQSREAFVVKYNKNRKMLWARQIPSSENATGYAIVKDEKGDLYAAGSFKGDINPGESYPVLSCKENRSDVFLAKIGENGQLIWIKKAGLDTYPQENYYSYNVTFSEDGSNRGATFYSEDEFNNNFGLSYDASGLLSLTGSFMSSTGFALDMLSLKTDEGTGFNVSESLKLENDKLIGNEYEKTIAGVFSVFNHVKLSGFKMLGVDAQKTLDQYNPAFRKEYPKIYKGLGQINFIFNEDGIVLLETVDARTVLLLELKIKNNAKMKVTPFEDGNAKVDILEGVQVGKFFIWFKLNFVKLYKNDGNILFDYNSDNSQLLLNLKEDILE